MKHSVPLSTQSVKEKAMDLDKMMSIDHVVRVREDGTVTDEGIAEVYAPEIYCEYSGPFADAQILAEHDAAMVAYVKAQGWDVLNGWSGQYSYSGPIMHPSEFVGGRLADHIRETPGYWVACAVDIHPNEGDPEYNDGNGESSPVGWVLAHKEIPEPLPAQPGTTVHPNGLREWDAGIITNF